MCGFSHTAPIETTLVGDHPIHAQYGANLPSPGTASNAYSSWDMSDCNLVNFWATLANLSVITAVVAGSANSNASRNSEFLSESQSRRPSTVSGMGGVADTHTAGHSVRLWGHEMLFGTAIARFGLATSEPRPRHLGVAEHDYPSRSLPATSPISTVPLQPLTPSASSSRSLSPEHPLLLLLLHPLFLSFLSPFTDSSSSSPLSAHLILPFTRS